MKKPSLLSGFAFGLPSLALFPALPLAHAAAPAAVDGPAATPEDYDAIQTRAKATHGAYHEIVPDDSFLADANAEARSAAAATAVPLLQQVLTDLDGMIAARPANEQPILAVAEGLQAEMAVLAGPDAVETRPEPIDFLGDEATQAGRIELRAAWLRAGDDEAARAKVLD